MQNIDARAKSLQGLMGAMDEDEAKRIPGITIIINGQEQGAGEQPTNEEPVEGMEPEAPDMGDDLGGLPSSFAELLKKKRGMKA